MRQLLLKVFYCLRPFDIRGDFSSSPKEVTKEISCLIVTKGKASFLQNLLYDLGSQTLRKDQFEVIIVNSREEKSVDEVCAQYDEALDLIYVKEPALFNRLGEVRNLSASYAKGEILLFLDDDTRILQTDFLERSINFFKDPNVGIVMPYGKAAYGIVKQKYDFLDRHSFATRCLLVKRELFEKVGGFYDFLAYGYEDIEIGIRYSLMPYKIIKTEILQYYHPPLYFSSMQKPFCIGQAVFLLRRKYPVILWLLVYFNALRFFLYAILPTTKNLQWAKISLGVLCAPFLKKQYTY